MQVKIRVLPQGACAVALAALLAACAAPYGPNYYPASSTNPYGYGTQAAPAGTYGTPAAPAASPVEYGRITNVALISSGGPVATGNDPAGPSSAAWSAAFWATRSAVAAGRASATVLGVVGGAAVGSHLAGGNRVYDTAAPVHASGCRPTPAVMRTFDVNATGNLRAGDRVRIENGQIYLACLVAMPGMTARRAVQCSGRRFIRAGP